MKPNINFVQIFLVIWYDVLFPWIQLIRAHRTINDIKTWNHWKCFQFLMPLHELLCHYYNTKVIFQGCTQAMAHSGKSELQMQNTSLQFTSMSKSSSTEAFLCNILDLVNCVLWESSVLMLFSTCITEIFVTSTKAPENVIRHDNLKWRRIISKEILALFFSRPKHEVPLYSLEAHLMTKEKSTVHQYIVPCENSAW